ncbi:ADM_collapsed_G0028510.mRNA.1.CDS.1 [Saccharomyces cerevisiae]|nr:ADM_collapsed_G0028510.mRNA.1.CDS.1 [Saccharomyces cerevisiae]
MVLLEKETESTISPNTSQKSELSYSSFGFRSDESKTSFLYGIDYFSAQRAYSHNYDYARAVKDV